MERPRAGNGSRSKGGVVIAILFVVFFLGNSDNQMISPLLPLMAREYGKAPGEIGKIIGPAYAIAAAIVALLVGPASDKFGRRRFLLYGSGLFGLSLLLVWFIKDLNVLASTRFFTGLAAGTFSTCSTAYVGDYFPYERRGTAMSIVQSGYFAALVIGVPAGAALGQWLGWRSGFVLFGIFSIVTLALIWLLLPEDRHRMAEQRLADNITRRFDNIRLVFHGRAQVAAVIGGFFVSAGFVGFIYYLGAWLTSSFGLQTGQVGLVFIVVGVASLIGSIVAGPIADRVGKRPIAIAATVVLAALLMLIPRFGWGAGLFASLLAASIAYAFRQGPLHALATVLVPARAIGSLVAARITASQIGIAASTAACGRLYTESGYAAVGIFSAAMTLGAVVCIYFMKEPQANAFRE